MKSNLFFLPLLGLLFLSGCESMPNRVRERFNAAPPKERVFDGDQATVYAAAQQAFKRLDFNVTRSNPTELEAVSRINSSVVFADARQLVAELRLRDAGPGKTRVELSLIQQVESQSLGGTSRQPLHEHSLFDLYFTTLQQVLQEQGFVEPAKEG